MYSTALEVCFVCYYSSQNKGRWRPLPEREAAYAEARMRIFGSTDNSDTTDSKAAAGQYENSSISRQIQTLKVNNSVSIIRQPKGPDGSKGFGNT